MTAGETDPDPAADPAQEFRAEFRAWLAEHVTPQRRALGFQAAPDAPWLAAMRDWNAELADAGYGAISWPARFGGRDAGVWEQVAFAEECDSAGAPGTLNPIGLANIAPSIMQFGTEPQQQRFLRPMLRGEDIWCQGFSEPDAGSDLASLGCSAVPHPSGDGWIVTGQKVWNTFGGLAQWCELLVRTDTSGPKHHGITCLLVDMSLPGIDVRPLRTLTGDAEFHEIFFTEVHVPAHALLGEIDQGWTVAMATLGFERGGVAALHLQTRRRIAELIAACRSAGVTDDPRVRQKLSELYSRGETLRWLADRSIARAATGQQPGPESSLIKVVWSQVGQTIGEVAVDTLGFTSLGVDTLNSEWGRSLLHGRSLTIAGGTTEVNRNIIGERVLGLPREPR